MRGCVDAVMRGCVDAVMRLYADVVMRKWVYAFTGNTSRFACLQFDGLMG